MTEPIYHLASPDDWARSSERYFPPAFEEEGFIHCSTARQLTKVAHELFGDRNDLVLLTIDPDALDDETLVYEDLYGLGEEFPHIYDSLPTSAVRGTGPYLAHLEEGLWLPEKRFDRAWMDRILHAEYSEVGASGRISTREEILDTRPARFQARLPLKGYRLVLIDEDVALAGYISRDVYQAIQRTAHRTSIWVNTNDGWRLRFHQGTPLG